MALSGSISTNDYSGRYYQFSWTATQSAATNTSTVTWTIKALGGSSNWYAERTLKAVINGTYVVNKTDRVERWSGTVATGTISIPHNTDGSKSFDMSIRVACYRTSVNLSASGSFTLNDIPRQATLTSAPNFTDEENPVITYSNPAGTAATSLQACISLDRTNDDIAYRDVPKTGSSYTFELTDAERNVLRNATPNANSRSVVFFLKTTVGDDTFSSTLTKTLSIVNAAPTLSPTVVDNDSVSTALTGDTNTLVRYISNARYTLGVGARKGASIKSTSVSVGGKTASGTSGVIEDVDSGTFIFRVTDSRGNSTSKTVTKTLINYVNLTCNISISNPTTDGTATVTVSGKYFNGSFGATKNTLTLVYRQKTGNGSYGNWITLTPTFTGDNYSAKATLTGLDYLTSYTFQAQATDKIATISTPAKTVRSTPVFDWGSSDFKFNVPIYDCFGTTMTNGMAVYESGAGIDPDTTLESLILTYNNTPMSGKFMYIQTFFYNNKSTSSNRAQIAIPYNGTGLLYHRFYSGGVWSDWTNNALAAYPVNSIYIGYSHTSPASLFGGTWARIASRFLWGTPDTGTIGATAGEMTHVLTIDEMPAHDHPIRRPKWYSGDDTSDSNQYAVYGQTSSTTYSTRDEDSAIGDRGGGAAHNNMPPYVNVAIWRRTA